MWNRRLKLSQSHRTHVGRLLLYIGVAWSLLHPDPETALGIDVLQKNHTLYYVIISKYRGSLITFLITKCFLSE